MESIFRRDSDSKIFICYWREGHAEDIFPKYPADAIECEMYTETVVKYRPLPRTNDGHDALVEAFKKDIYEVSEVPKRLG